MSEPADHEGIETVTLGCRLNAYETEVMQNHARAAGLENVTLVNTCAVTNEAVRSSRQQIRKAAKARPDAKIIVTGCAAQIDPDMFAAMPEVDRVIGNTEKMKAETFSDLLGKTEKVRVNDIMSVTETAGHLVDGLKERARAYVQVQNGCDHRCTFCIIPYGRGNSRSVPAGEVVAQVKNLVSQGYHEVVLTGVDISSWGGDLPGAPPLGDLVRRVLKLVPSLPRLRLSSIDSAEIDPVLFDLFAGEERLAPYLHLSLQHGDNMILKRMKRRHLREDAIDLCTRLKAVRPGIAFGADMIAGFPTETEEMFDNAVRLVEDCDLSWLHVFPFSPRDGAPAAKMPQLERPLIKARAARLRAAGDAARHRHLERRIGDTDTGLLEKPDFARLGDFTPVKLRVPAETHGHIASVRITGHDGETALGELA